MKILPTMNRGVVFMHEDGTFEMAPFQVFRSATGMLVIRIGANAYYFDENGKFDGGECNAGHSTDMTEEKAAEIAKAYEAEKANQGQPPDWPYFEEGTKGHHAETRMWNDAEMRKPAPKSNTVYAVAVPTKKGPSL